MEENHTVNVSKESLWRYTTVILGAIVLVGVLYIMAGGSSTGNTISGSAVGTIDSDDLTDDDAIKGDPDAPVTIVEFSDFQCPFCGKWFLQTYPQIKKEYIDTG